MSDPSFSGNASWLMISLKQFSRFRAEPRYYQGLSLLGLCLYSYLVAPQRTDSIPKIVANPHRSVGREIKLGSDTKVIWVRPQEFQVEQAGAVILVKPPENLQREWESWRRQLQPGDYVSLKGMVQPGGFLRLQNMHIHKGRMLKVWVSLAGLLVFGGILVHESRERTCLIS
jgi:hypothetical protein